MLGGKPHSGKGLPNRKPGKLERLGIHMGAADYSRTRKLMRDKLPYNGSEEQMQHRRLFWR